MCREVGSLVDRLVCRLTGWYRCAGWQAGYAGSALSLIPPRLLPCVLHHLHSRFHSRSLNLARVRASSRNFSINSASLESAEKPTVNADYFLFARKKEKVKKLMPRFFMLSRRYFSTCFNGRSAALY